MLNSILADRGRIVRAVGGALVAGLLIVALGDFADANAARRRTRRGRALSIQLVNLDGKTNVPANSIIEVVFNTSVDDATINPAQFQVREQNATQTGFTKQIFGAFQVVGNVVRFFPRLPTHLRDPESPTGDFYPFGSLRDNAAENAGLQPSKNYELLVLGRGSIAPIRSTRGRILRKTAHINFSTAAATDPAEHFTTTTYTDSPPPQYSLSNPADRTPAAKADQYAWRGGTPDVPSQTSLSVFCTRVPLSPITARIQGNITLTLLERDGDTSIRRPVQGDVFVEQNFNGTLLVFRPRFPLPDRSKVALRITKNVLDLTEEYDFQPRRERQTLRALFDSLVDARNQPVNAGLPASQLPDPPIALIGDWPSDAVARGILKENLLDLGDNAPDEIDPRVVLLFTTRDEPVTNAELVINFTKAENLFDGQRSTAEWDLSIPGTASAIMTVAGGSAVNGDFKPTSDTVLNMDTFPDNTAQFRDVVIPQGVTVSLTGTRPASLLALNFTLHGTLAADGLDGEDGGSGSYLTTYSSSQLKDGGAGGPGGGDGADSPPRPSNNQTNPATTYYGLTGEVGVDANGDPASPDDGGRGGLGGENMTGSYYMMGGGGGGGGGKGPGQAGSAATYASWNSSGGAGGAGALGNDDLDPLVGGAGGGSGGPGTFRYSASTTYLTWHKTSAGGGGGGGGIKVQTARVLTITGTGRILARGGSGGRTSTSNGTIECGAGGGGGGGSIRLDSTGGFAIADPVNSLDVSGGPGGTRAGNYAGVGGDGGLGFLLLSDPNGGLLVPGGAAGFFDPVGGGVPSFVWSKFADMGVDGTRVVNFTNDDIETNPTSDDAIFVEMQMTREHPAIFGEPDLTALDANGNSLNQAITSAWVPIKIHDNTSSPTGAFVVPGWDKGANGSEVVFPIEQLNGNGYRFARFRIFFQLDDLQSRLSPLPYVERIVLHFQFNF